MNQPGYFRNAEGQCNSLEKVDEMVTILNRGKGYFGISLRKQIGRRKPIEGRTELPGLSLKLIAELNIGEKDIQPIGLAMLAAN